MARLRMRASKNIIGLVSCLVLGVYYNLTLQYSLITSKQLYELLSIFWIVLNLCSFAMSIAILPLLFLIYLFAPFISNLLTILVFPYSTATNKGVLPSFIPFLFKVVKF